MSIGIVSHLKFTFWSAIGHMSADLSIDAVLGMFCGSDRAHLSGHPPLSNNSATAHTFGSANMQKYLAHHLRNTVLSRR